MARSEEIGLLRRSADALRRQGDLRAAEQVERSIRALAREDLPGRVKRLLESAQESAHTSTQDAVEESTSESDDLSAWRSVTPAGPARPTAAPPG